MTQTIIGLGGTNGAGKDTVGLILAKEYNFLFFTVTDLLRQEAKRLNLPIERPILRTISSEWRAQSGGAVLIDKAYDEYLKVQEHYSGLVISSLRNPLEADKIHQLNGQVLWIDADPLLRYHRIQDNINQRNRPEDVKTFEQFIKEENEEMRPLGDHTDLDMLAVKEKADIVIINDLENVDDLRSQVLQTVNLTSATL